MPHLSHDLTVMLTRHGYRGVELDRRHRGGEPTYLARMLGRRAVVLGSEEAARAFYDPALVARAGAVPAPLKDLLFGRGAVHGLDGASHRRRKELMRQLVGDDQRLLELVRVRLDAACREWQARPDGDVFGALVEAYGRAVLDWAGCDPSTGEARRISRELALIVDGFGGAGASYVRAWEARRRVQTWLRRRIREVRTGARHPTPASALEVLGKRRDLSVGVAAVELGNLVRPTVAVAWLGAFVALRLAQHPEWQHLLATDTVGAEHVAFAHEIRRTTPFVPVLAGRARRAFSIDGVRVRAGDRLVLDVWGIDSDPRRFPDGDFDPDRFWRRTPEPFEMFPQGGGDVMGHRCPGEQRTVGMLAETARVMAMTPPPRSEPWSVDLERIPTRPT